MRVIDWGSSLFFSFFFTPSSLPPPQDNCVKVNITSYESLMEHACNAMSKNYPIVLPFPAFNEILRNAVDSVGAFSLLNPDWKAVAETEGIPIPDAPTFGADKYGIYG